MESAIQEVTELMSKVFAVPRDPHNAPPGQQTTKRADALKEALPVAEKAWRDGSLDIVTLFAEKVADGARDCKLPLLVQSLTNSTTTWERRS
jgi:hypothetical protein